MCEPLPKWGPPLERPSRDSRWTHAIGHCAPFADETNKSLCPSPSISDSRWHRQQPSACPSLPLAGPVPRGAACPPHLDRGLAPRQVSVPGDRAWAEGQPSFHRGAGSAGPRELLPAGSSLPSPTWAPSCESLSAHTAHKGTGTRGVTSGISKVSCCAFLFLFHGQTSLPRVPLLFKVPGAPGGPCPVTTALCR